MFERKTGSNSFADKAFGEIDLGDARLDRRFRQVVQAALEHPEKSLPDKFRGDPAGYTACLRLFNHPDVPHEKILFAHQATVLGHLESDESPAVVLLIHDTTDLDFSGHQTLADDLGQIGNGGGKGWLCHNSLAVDPDSREILGLLSQLLHVRPQVGKGESVAAKRERADRESRLWLRAIDEIGPSPADKLWVDVCDRGADIFEFLQALRDRKRHFVIRSSHNRALQKKKEQEQQEELEVMAEQEPQSQEPTLLHDFMRGRTMQVAWQVEVGATKKRQGRVAAVGASACPVTLKPPHVRKGEYRKEPVPLWAIRVWELNPPAGEEGLEWLLLTDQAITDGQALRRVVGWYETRAVVEEFHKGQKTGVGIEKLHLQDAENLQAAIALLSVVALALVNLRIAARDAEKAERPAREYVPALWVRVLSIWRHKGQVRADMTVREFTLALARLGGHLNRKSDGLPGWITLWRGWERFHTMLDYELSRSTCDEL